MCAQVGRVDLEINRLTKILFLATILLSIVLLSVKVRTLTPCHMHVTCMSHVCHMVQGFKGPWFVYLIRYIILFSYIIPIR